MAGRQAIVQLQGLRGQGHLFRAWLTEEARARRPAPRRRQACHKPVAAGAVHGGGEQQLAHEGVLREEKAPRGLG
jgi:hypothetical protein